jgi:hypothetical protein
MKSCFHSLIHFLPFLLNHLRLPSPELNQILDNSLKRVESYVTTDGQSASLSLNKAPTLGLRPDFYYCQTVAGLFMWGALSDERTGLSFTTAAGPRQRSHFGVRVPWNSRSYFTVSKSRLPFLSPPTTSRATVEVFDPTSTWDSLTRHGPRRKHSLSIVEKACLLIRCLATDVIFLRVYAFAVMCLPSRCLAMGLEVTICKTTLTYRIVRVKCLTLREAYRESNRAMERTGASKLCCSPTRLTITEI